MAKIQVEVSARHCHLCQKDIDKLFGQGYQLTEYKKVSQPGQYASQEEIIIKGPKGQLTMRIVGPARKQSQIELAITDCFRVGVKPELRVSGNLNGSPGILLIGPKGNVKLSQGVIVAQRHVHVSPVEAKQLKVKKGQIVKVKISGQRALIFDKVVVRTGDNHKKSFQIDTDEGNACGWVPGMEGELI